MRPEIEEPEVREGAPVREEGITEEEPDVRSGASVIVLLAAGEVPLSESLVSEAEESVADAD